MSADRIPDISRMVPKRAAVHATESAGRVSLERPRGGAVGRGVLKAFGVPGTVRVNLDPLGSEVWQLIDGRRTVGDIRTELATRHPEETQLAQRLGHYFSVLVSQRLVELGPA